MNNTDQAFIKAYSKLSGAQRQEKHASGSSVAGRYVDSRAGDFHRTESAHGTGTPHFSGPAVPAAGPPARAADAPGQPTNADMHAQKSTAGAVAGEDSGQAPYAYPPPAPVPSVGRQPLDAGFGERISANGVNVAYPITDDDPQNAASETTAAGEESPSRARFATDEALESMRQGQPFVVSMRWELGGTVTDSDAPPTAGTAARPREDFRAGETDVRTESVVATRDAETSRKNKAPKEPTAGELAQQAEASELATPAFRAVWEVDQFVCSDTLEQLALQLAQQLDEVGRELARSSRQGLGRLAVTGLTRGVGTTTVAIQLARAAVGAGVRVALVDGNFASPGTCDLLGVEAEQGWDDALEGGLAVAEAAVQSIADDLTLLPLCPVASRGRAAAAGRMTELLEQLGADFDLVIIDAGSADDALGAGSQHLSGDCVDAAMLVADTRAVAARAYGDAVQSLRRARIAHIGLIENFCTT